MGIVFDTRGKMCFSRDVPGIVFDTQEEVGSKKTSSPRRNCLHIRNNNLPTLQSNDARSLVIQSFT